MNPRPAYTHTHTESHTHLQESSSFLLGVFPLTEPLRPYSPLLPLMNDLVSPGLWQGSMTAVPLLRPGTTSNNPTQPSSCTCRVPEDRGREIRYNQLQATNTKGR